MSNQHVVEVSIIWPDDKWEAAAEQEYLVNTLQVVIENFQENPVCNQDERRVLVNKYGRTFAEIHICPCVPQGGINGK